MGRFWLAGVFVLCAVGGMTFSLATRDAAANDRKIAYGAECLPFDGGSMSDLTYSGTGVRNDGASGQTIRCPILRDNTSNSSGGLWDFEAYVAAATGSPYTECTVIARSVQGQNELCSASETTQGKSSSDGYIHLDWGQDMYATNCDETDAFYYMSCALAVDHALADYIWEEI